MNNQARIAGVGMVPFTTPSKAQTYDVMGEQAAKAALADAGISYDRVQQAFASYIYGDSCSGQKALYRVGLTGIPIINVNNNCGSGSTALFLARQLVESGAADCVLAVGFEQMQRGKLVQHWIDRPTPFVEFDGLVEEIQGVDPVAPMAAQYFGGAGREYAERYGIEAETWAMVSVKARKHAANNPYAAFRDPVTVGEVLASTRISGHLTRLQCCPPTCGAAAAVVISEDFARRNGLRTDVVIRAQALVTDTPEVFEDKTMTQVVGYDMSKRAADLVYETSGVDPEDIAVAEVHDCFTTHEVLAYEALRLTPEGTAEKFVRDGDNTYGGRVVVNPSGGLLAKGHPIGATGLAQCAELVWQLRGQASGRQVEDARLALQHNVGLGGTAVVTLYESLG
ncbi:MAG TPA: lipid-transfer protein [Aldersonia sp.]